LIECVSLTKTLCYDVTTSVVSSRGEKICSFAELWFPVACLFDAFCLRQFFSAQSKITFLFILPLSHSRIKSYSSLKLLLP